jgi:hypothetical protein
MKKIGVLDNSVELLFADADGPLEAAAGGSQEAAAGRTQEDPVTKPRPCVAPVLLDFEELFDDKEVVLGISGGILVSKILKLLCF